nr:hypothetical protein CFP56_02636 [Quercus suber]
MILVLALLMLLSPRKLLLRSSIRGTLADNSYSFRRPATTDTRSFFYCNEEKWDEWLAAAASDDKSQKKVALNNLRKYSAAGLIMETGAGKAAVSPCSWCTRTNALVDCRVFADREDKACAYCKVKAKAGCTAAVASVATIEDRVKSLESQVAGLAVTSELLMEKFEALESRLA